MKVGKMRYIAAVNALQRAFLNDGVKDHREALEDLDEVIREARAWSNEIEDEITRELEEHAHNEIARTT